MNTLLRPTLALGLIFLFTSAVSAQRRQELAERVEVTRNIEYHKVAERALHVDLYLPKQNAEEKLPVVVWIHGGGWQGGNKSSGGARLLPLVASGKYAGVSVEYRLTDAGPWPIQIHDCKAAIRWVRAHAEEHGLDPDRIAVWGSSAGGHLVSMLGTSGDVKELEGDGPYADQSSRVACVVDFCGPSNFLLFAQDAPRMRRPGSPVYKLLGGPAADKQDIARQASPSTYASGDDPPFLIVHGTSDRTVPFSQAEHFVEELKKAGVDTKLVTIIGGGHGIGGREVNERVKSFLAKHLLGEEVEVSDAAIELEGQ